MCVRLVSRRAGAGQEVLEGAGVEGVVVVLLVNVSLTSDAGAAVGTLDGHGTPAHAQS